MQDQICTSEIIIFLASVCCQGDVSMSVTAILPSDRETADLVPGDFTATNGEGESERLQSFGEILFACRKLKIYTFCALANYLIGEAENSFSYCRDVCNHCRGKRKKSAGAR